MRRVLAALSRARLTSQRRSSAQCRVCSTWMGDSGIGCPTLCQSGQMSIVVPRRAAVFETEDAFDLGIANTEILESILASNRFVVRPIDRLPPDVLGWTFFTVDESPYLSNHFITEWRFGVTLAARVRNHLFVFDFDGLTFSPSRVGAARPAEGSMTRLLPASSTITQVSANSLDMSDRAIRFSPKGRGPLPRRSLDLLDPMLRPTTVTGYVGGSGRYIGIVRAKVADATDENVSITDFMAWAREIEVQLTDKNAAPNSVFLRYATRVKPDRDKAEKPVNILLDLTEEALREFGLRGGGDRANPPDGVLAYEDLCADIENNKFSIKGLDGVDVACSIRFNPETLRYAISSKALNERHPPARNIPSQSRNCADGADQHFPGLPGAHLAGWRRLHVWRVSEGAATC